MALEQIFAVLPFSALAELVFNIIFPAGFQKTKNGFRVRLTHSDTVSVVGIDQHRAGGVKVKAGNQWQLMGQDTSTREKQKYWTKPGPERALKPSATASKVIAKKLNKTITMTNTTRCFTVQLLRHHGQMFGCSVRIQQVSHISVTRCDYGFHPWVSSLFLLVLLSQNKAVYGKYVTLPPQRTAFARSS